MVGDAANLFSALSQFGAFGILVAYLIWKDIRSDRAREKADSEHKAEIVAIQERRIAYDRERLETDKDLAAALASLTSAIDRK